MTQNRSGPRIPARRGDGGRGESELAGAFALRGERLLAVEIEYLRCDRGG